MFSQAVPKQRGIYSEILTTEDTQNLNVSFVIQSNSIQAVSTFGPNKDNIVVVNQKQKMPRAQGKSFWISCSNTLGLKKKDFLLEVE
jgi:hypothetical protein